MTKEIYKEYIPALLRGDTARADEISDEVPEEDGMEFFLFVAAFFSTMLDQRFGTKVTYDDIYGFVREMEYDYREAEPPIKPLMIEGTLRGVCLEGEEHRLDEVPMEEQFRAYTLVIKKIVLQSPEVSANLGNFITTASARHDDMLKELGD